jgi:hypothetical protein
MSDTPRTDAEASPYSQGPDGRRCIRIDFARTLERELVATKAWKDVVIEGLVVAHIYHSDDEADPRKALNRLICDQVAIALDPQVSSDAAALIELGRQELKAEVEALRAVVQSLVDGTNAYGDGGRWSVNMQTVLKARAALAKEQP